MPTAKLPDPFATAYPRFRVAEAGRHLVMSDLHLPYHDRRAVEQAVADGKRNRVAGVILNGDVLDFHDLSDHRPDSTPADTEAELDLAGEFLAYLRQSFRKARIVYKLGNHDERLKRFLLTKAKPLAGSKRLELGKLIGAADHGVEMVGDQRVIDLGRLPLVHGHEFGGGSGGMYPARWLFLRTYSAALCGHFHRASSAQQRALDGRVLGTWSLGCLCYLHPEYARNNQWDHGWALVDVANDGSFEVTPRRPAGAGRAV